MCPGSWTASSGSSGAIFELSRIFNFEPGGTVYSRVDGLGSATGMVGFAWNGLREAVYGEHADRLILLTYETLTWESVTGAGGHLRLCRRTPVSPRPRQPSFTDAEEFDARLGTPGLHAVGRSVQPTERKTILPPDLFARFDNDAFWRDLRQLPAGTEGRCDAPLPLRRGPGSDRNRIASTDG